MKTPAVQVLQCNFTAANGTYLNNYPWTDTGELRPVGSQWVQDSLRPARFYIQNNACVGDVVSVTGDTNVAGAQSSIDLGSPARKITCNVKQTYRATKVDVQILFRVPATVTTYRSTYPGDAIYHSVQLLRSDGGPPKYIGTYILNLWGIRFWGDLLAQARVNSEIAWQASYAYEKVEPFFDINNTLRGDTVIPDTGANGFIYNCVTAGTSAVIGSKPNWAAHVTAGEVWQDGSAWWQTQRAINYQSGYVPLEIIDTGSMIKVTLDSDLQIHAFDTTNYDKTVISLNAGHDSGETFYDNLKAWI